MKQDQIKWLQSSFPWLTEEMAEIVGKRLTGMEISMLRNELNEARNSAIVSCARNLLKMSIKERTELLEKFVETGNGLTGW